MEEYNKVLEIDGLSKSYGKVKALDDIDVYVPKGKVAGLVGPNGAGKTTLIKCVNGFLDYTGNINVMGFSDVDQIKQKVGYLAEDEGYYSDWTASEYLQYFSKLYLLDDEKRKIEEKLELVGLYDRKDGLIKEYSNGMKKRLGLARTLLHEPNLLILDEPLAGLDPKIKYELTQLIRSIGKGEKSVLISSHQLKDIEEICDWIIFIKNGEVVKYGDPKSISQAIRSQKTIVFDINNPDDIMINELEDIESITESKIKENTLIVKGNKAENFEKDIFMWLIKNDVDFSLRHGSLDDMYREILK